MQGECQVFGGIRNHESQHTRTRGTGLVSKRTKDQCRAHRKGSREGQERTVISNPSGKEKVRSFLIASKARWDVQLKGLVELERRRQSFRADAAYLCERQEVLKDLVVRKKDMQRTAPQDCQRKIRGVEGVGGAEGKKKRWYSCKRSTC